SPSLAKSAARIDGAMTRGRDANCWDMCVFPNLFEGADRLRVTWGRAGGNAAGLALLWAEKSAVSGSSCRLERIERGAAEPVFIGLFAIFAMARRLLMKGTGLLAALAAACWSSVMLFALGAASSAID